MTTPASPGQVAVLNKTLGKYCTNRPMRLYVAGKLIGRTITSTKEITADEWRTFRDAAFPNWRDGDWTESEAMKSRIRKTVWEYERDVLGQQELPI